MMLHDLLLEYIKYTAITYNHIKRPSICLFRYRSMKKGLDPKISNEIPMLDKLQMKTPDFRQTYTIFIFIILFDYIPLEQIL